MAKSRAKAKEKGRSFWHYFFHAIWFIIKIPYYIVKYISLFFAWIGGRMAEAKIASKRSAMKPVFESLKVIKTQEGDIDDFLDTTANADSRIGIILGARGAGKTAFGVKLMENLHTKTKKHCYAIGFREEDFPSWINVVENVSQIKNDSLVLIDEGGVLFNSRNAMSSANKLLSELILVARHKNLTILFISQNSANLEINIIRQADFLVLKPSSLLQKEFERNIVQKMYEKASKGFEKYKSVKGITYIYSREFTGFISNPLPSFWGQSISKSFR
jgi:hypothetical protein